MNSVTKSKSAVSHRREMRYYGPFRELSITYEGVSEEIIIRPPDLSEQGIFIQTFHRFPEGAVLKVHFRLAESGIEVKARGEVRYCLPGVGVGVEFIDLSSDAKDAIAVELRNRESPQRL